MGYVPLNNKLLLIAVLATALLGTTWYLKNEILACVRAWYFQVPFPRYSVAVERDVPIVMEDGVTLYADIYPTRRKTRSFMAGM